MCQSGSANRRPTDVYEHLIEDATVNLYETVRWDLGRKPSAVSFEDGVTLARDGFEARAVEDDYSFVSVVDQSCALQRARRQGHGWAAHAQHGGKEVLGHRELVAADPIACGQQPSGTTLVHGVEGVARDRSHQKRDEYFRVPVDQSRKRPSSIHFAVKRAYTHGLSGAVSGFHHSAGEPTVSAKERVHANDPFIPDSGDFYNPSVPHDLGDRAGAATGKVDRSQRFAWVQQDMLEGKRDGIESRQQTSVVGYREACEKLVRTGS